MASTSAARSVSASIGRAMESKTPASESPEQPFGKVLAGEVSRQENNPSAQAGKPVNAPSPQAKDETGTEAESGATDSAQQANQDAASMPWLLMLQQTVAAQPAQPSSDVAGIPSAGDKSTGPGEDVLADTGAGLLAASQLVSQSESSRAAAVPSGLAGGSVAQGMTPASAPLTAVEQKAGAGGGLAANPATVSGKDLPQVADEKAVSTNFAKVLSSHVDEGEVAKLQQLGSLAQPIISQTPAGGEHGVQAATQHVIAEPVGDSRWGEAVAQRVSLMLGQKEQQIEMQLNPPQLGPMEVRLTLGQEQASVVFASQHAAVREALAAATPRLTALLADQGIHLVNVQVASDSLQQHAQEQSRQQQSASSFADGARNGRFYEGDAATPVWRSDVALPVARSGVSLYV